ncbi:hypothetical protein V5735_04465 (plasmid) [Haladaptatus sp. SPP-AMP-3]|uniref:hypothetical protein n=1 Tax=Haladaptatus sp. SPP-AMP-3 TaxID=3121295 RepID=UPI003C2CE735
MIGTRSVLAVVAGGVMVTAIVALRSGRKSTGLWLLAAGFFVASLWSGLSIAWTRNNPGMLSSDSHLLLGSTAVAGTIYYGMLAREATSD